MPFHNCLPECCLSLSSLLFIYFFLFLVYFAISILRSPLPQAYIILVIGRVGARFRVTVFEKNADELSSYILHDHTHRHLKVKMPVCLSFIFNLKSSKSVAVFIACVVHIYYPMPV